MKLFFGKISKEYNQSQINEGFYEAPKGSTWFGDLELGDYVYLIGGDKIQFWRAQEWRKHDDKDRLYFQVLNADLNISLNDLIALNFLQLSKALFVLTSRSSPKAFHKLELLQDISPTELYNPNFYQDENIYRTIQVVKQESVVTNSRNIQLYINDDKLFLVQASFYTAEVYNSFRDNLQYLGKGAPNKDKALKSIADNLNGGILTRKDIGFRNFYDAFFCEYNERKYFLVGAFWNDHDPQDVTQLFVSRNSWQNGYTDQFLKETNSIAKGSFIAIKSAYTRERTRSVMMIKARGVVTKNHKDGRNLDVEWEKNFEPFEVNFGGYMTTVKEVVNDDHIEAIWGSNNSIETFQKDDMNNDLIDLLKYKKQIILQGPPGTGKTKLAKEIASTVTSQFALNEHEISSLLQKNDIIRSVHGDTEYKIDSVQDNKVILSGNGIQNKNISFQKILDFYNHNDWNQSVSNGDDRGAYAIAYFIFKKKQQSEQIKIIQFHPSYSYEDFVRGIVAKPNPDGEGILYEAENKALAKFAQQAHQNFVLSQVLVPGKFKTLSQFDSFIQQLKDQIADSTEQKVNLTEAVYLFEPDITRFKYKGDNWKAHNKGLNMKYSELEKIIASGIRERAEVKNIQGLEELTKQHASYFIRVVDMYYEYLKINPVEEQNVQPELRLKNYVLIIDEINRANLSSVLGELIYALEYRNEKVESMYEIDEDNKVVLPPNLYIIGTMNTADRSVGHIDYAIRRRFAFVDVPPKILSDVPFKKEIFETVSKLFVKEITVKPEDIRPSEHLSEEFRPQDVWLGHSYFIQQYKKTDSGSDDKTRPIDFKMRLKYEIIPILEEYIKDGVLKDSANQILAELKSQCP
jgi:MoxR-like ATPase